MTAPTTCILILVGPSAEPLKPFDEVSRAKVVEIQKKRCSMFTKSKFWKISLPETWNSTMGYHSSCYKNFTALPSKRGEIPSTNPPKESTTLLRSNVIHPSTSSSGIFEHKCIFCNKVRKKISRDKPEELPTSVQYDHGQNSIQEAAKSLQDSDLLAKISGLVLIAKELKFHHSCRRNYIARARRFQDEGASIKPSAHEEAIEKIKDYVQKTLIDNLGAEKLTSLFERYTDIVGTVETSYTAQKLSEKLLKDFPYLLKTCKRSNKEGVVVYNHLLESDDAYKRAIFVVHSLKEAAFYLRKLILSSEITELPTPLTTKAIEIGQADKPNELVEFFSSSLHWNK